MFKKWQPGFPCNTLVLGNVYDLSSCIRLRLGGFLNDSCECCTDFNGETYHQNVYGVGRLVLSDDAECSSYSLLTFLYGPDFQAICDCVGDVPVGPLKSQFYLIFEEACEHVLFQVALSAGTEAGLSFGWGYWPFDEWASPGADEAAARNAIRQLAGGQTVRIPIDLSHSQWDVCDISGAYVDVSLVDGSNCGGTPTNTGCHTGTTVADCVFAPPHLTVSDFDDCDSGGVITYLSRLNRLYECHRVMISEQPTPSCTFVSSTVADALFQCNMGTLGEFGDGIPDATWLGDPGILIKRIGGPTGARTETWVYSVGFGVLCNSSDLLIIGLFWLYYHVFEIDDFENATFSRSDCAFWFYTGDAVATGESDLSVPCQCVNTMQTIFYVGNTISPCEPPPGTDPDASTFIVSTILNPPITA